MFDVTVLLLFYNLYQYIQFWKIYTNGVIPQCYFRDCNFVNFISLLMFQKDLFSFHYQAAGLWADILSRYPKYETEALPTGLKLLFSKHVTRTVRTNTDYRLPYISCDFNDSPKYSRAIIPLRTWWEALSIDITKVWRTKIEMSALRKRKSLTFWDTAQNVRATLDSWELLTGDNTSVRPLRFTIYPKNHV